MYYNIVLCYNTSMNHTIYIRKENQEFWSNLKDKSEFVNALLEKEKAGREIGHEYVGKLQDKIEERVSSQLKEETA